MTGQRRWVLKTTAPLDVVQKELAAAGLDVPDFRPEQTDGLIAAVGDHEHLSRCFSALGGRVATCYFQSLTPEGGLTR